MYDQAQVVIRAPLRLSDLLYSETRQGGHRPRWRVGSDRQGLAPCTVGTTTVPPTRRKSDVTFNTAEISTPCRSRVDVGRPPA